MKPVVLRVTAKQHAALIDLSRDHELVLGWCGSRRGRHRDIFMLHRLNGANEGHVGAHVSEPGKLKLGLVPIVVRKDADSRATKTPGATLALVVTLDIQNRLRGVLREQGCDRPLDRVVTVGDQLVIDDLGARGELVDDSMDLRQRQAFGELTNRRIRQLTVAVIGCSGTGSWVIEQLLRLGVARLVLVDPGKIQRRNLNRIVNSRACDVAELRAKVQVFHRAQAEAELPTQVETYPTDLDDREALLAVAECDLVFGCVDSAKGREDMARIGAFYTLPLIDVGTLIDPDAKGGVRAINGHVHYLIPGEFGLKDYGIYTDVQVRAEGLKKTDPETYARQVKEGYLPGVQEDSPAVVSVNGMIASLGVTELLMRLHRCRSYPDRDWRAIGVAITEMSCFSQKPMVAEPSAYLQRRLGRGDCVPLVDNPLFG